MLFKKYQSSKRYKHIIAYYWTLKSSDGESSETKYRFVPDAYVDWVFHLGEPWQCDFPNVENNHKTGQSHVFGQIKQHLDLTLPRKGLDIFGVKFYPWSVSQIWNLDMHYVTDNCLDLNLLEIPQINTLHERIYNTISVKGKIEVIESFLNPYLNSIDNDRSVQQYLLSEENSNNVESKGIGKRRLQQRFKSEIGISPKLFLRTLRINAAIDHMVKRNDESLTQLALGFNYFDQTHFIKDFKYFTGMCPTSFLNAINPNGDILNLRIPS
ncbi:DUF6597 domain-containing transcriptional factor [Psychroserpens sp. XS_ASV72]|uniref:AraC family transcriptional regulator n=1 Tax=Psychroserpens sp. XS_ASV72 TaxID=3241293 RepID=UPI0035170492